MASTRKCVPDHPKLQLDWQKIVRNVQGNKHKNRRGQRHLPKHLMTEEVRAEDRNFKPADPPGKYETA